MTDKQELLDLAERVEGGDIKGWDWLKIRDAGIFVRGDRRWLNKKRTAAILRAKAEECEE